MSPAVRLEGNMDLEVPCPTHTKEPWKTDLMPVSLSLEKVELPPLRSPRWL